MLFPVFFRCSAPSQIFPVVQTTHLCQSRFTVSGDVLKVFSCLGRQTGGGQRLYAVVMTPSAVIGPVGKSVEEGNVGRLSFTQN